MAVYDEDGNIIEGGKTPDEVEAEKKAAADAARAEVEKTSSEKISQLEKDLADATERAKQSSGKTDEQKAAEEAEVKKQQELLDNAKGAAKGAVMEIYREEQIGKLAGDDKKMEEAIRAALKNNSSPETTQEEINSKLRQAYVVASDMIGVKPGSNILTQSFGGGGGSSRPRSSNDNAPSEELIAFGANFGLTREDWKNIK